MGSVTVALLGVVAVLVCVLLVVVYRKKIQCVHVVYLKGESAFVGTFATSDLPDVIVATSLPPGRGSPSIGSEESQDSLSRMQSQNIKLETKVQPLQNGL